MRSHNVDILAQAALLKLYQHGLESRERLNARQIRALFTVDVSELFLEKALRALEKAGMAYGSHAGIRGSLYEIEHAGITAVQEAMSKNDTLISQISEHGDEWLLEDDRATVSDTPTHKPRFTEFRDALITALYEKSNEEGLNLYPLKDLADERGILYRDGWIFEVLTFLNEHDYALIVKSMGGDGTAAAKLKASGLEYAEGLIAEAESEENAPDVEPLFEIAGSSDTVIDDDGIPLVAVPASDRIVPLDHNSSEYKEATRTLDKVIEEFRKDHRLDNELGPEKPALLKTLEAGRRLLDDTKIKADIAITLLVEPLKLVAKRYESELVGALAAGAVTIILALLGFI